MAYQRLFLGCRFDFDVDFDFVGKWVQKKMRITFVPEANNFQRGSLTIYHQVVAP